MQWQAEKKLISAGWPGALQTQQSDGKVTQMKNGREESNILLTRNGLKKKGSWSFRDSEKGACLSLLQGQVGIDVLQ